MQRLRLQTALALAGLAFAGVLQAANVTLKSAWMRPAPGGAETARAYVDIESDAPVELVGADTPVARGVQIVLVRRIDDPDSEQVVKSLPVPVGPATRLAYRGNHLRLLGIAHDLGNGDPVPLTLTFKDAAGHEVRATTNVQVRGLLLPQQMAPASRDAATATSQAPGALPKAPDPPRM
jgi:copper(I)-binding protein